MERIAIRQFSSSLIHYDSKVHVITMRMGLAKLILDVSNCFPVFYSEPLNRSARYLPDDILRRV